MREPHQLQPTKTAKLPRRFIYFDSESKVDIHIRDDDIKKLLRSGEYALTDPEPVLKQHDPYLICATFKHKTNSGSTQRILKRYKTNDFPMCSDRSFCQTFWEDVENYARMNENLYVFAHNAKYDVQVTGCIHYLVRMGYTVSSFNDANPCIITLEKKFTHSPETKEKYQRAKGGRLVDDPKLKTITIVSSTNYYQQSLKDLGKVFGLEKLDFAHDEDFSMEKAEVYCDRDVEILEKAVDALIGFVMREDLGSFKLTIASQAFSAFRHRFLHGHEIFIHADEEALRTERRAYAGGRTEVIQRLGRIPEKAYYVDVNSMYPFVMKRYLYPTQLVKRWNFCDVDRLQELIMDDYLVICDAYVETDKPMFHKKQNRLIFPVGGFWTTLCTPELIKGLQEGVIKEVKNVCIYEADNYFESYVDYFYTKRLASKKIKDKVHDYLYKLFMNTLYGKFGQRNENWEPVADIDPEIIDTYTIYDTTTKTSETYKVFGGHVWKKNELGEREESVNSFPAVAAHVTSYARMLLWEAIETAGIENVYYCDTDSIMCNETGYNRLKAAGFLHDSELGKLKLEKIGTLHLYGCKDYRFILPVEATKVKRSRKARQHRRTWGRFKLSRRSLFYAETKIKGVSKYARPVDPTEDGKLRFAVTQWGGFTERLKNKSFASYYNQVIIKTLKRDYNKGLVEGAIVRPFRFNEKEDERKAAQAALMEEVNDLFVSDYLKQLCQLYGYIRTVRPGERFYAEYRAIPSAWKMRYFRKEGTPLDVWCNDNGKPVGELLTELQTKRTKKVS